jgi:histidinol-phosphatase (PHP family)
VNLPPDTHVHSEWSWDAPNGSMEKSCAQAVTVGLPAIAFTEHVDHTVWSPDLAGVDASHPVAVLAAADGRLTPPPFDVAGYLESIEHCRDRFPSLRIMSGLELGEPHWHAEAAERVLEAGTFDRVLGSLHCLPDDDVFREPPGLFGRWPPVEVVTTYLREVAHLVSESNAFSVLAHIDYPLRYWPEQSESLDLAPFEEAFRDALRATAQTGRALEINTVLPLDTAILRWWHEEGGEAVTFGSDAHDPSRLAQNFHEAAAMATALGFRAGREPFDLWPRAK